MTASAQAHHEPPAMPDEPAYSDAELAYDLVDRLNKSLRLKRLSVNEMAAWLEVHRNTVGAWLSGKNTPSVASLKEWAAKTEVPYMWLRYGPDSKPAEEHRSRSTK